MRAGKWVMVLLLVLAAVGGVGAWLYFSVPHTPEAQFALAEKDDKTMRGDVATKSAKDLQSEVDWVIEEYRRVGTRFGKNPKAAEGLKRIADIQEKILKDDAKALATLDELIKDYPEENSAGFALMEQARLLKEQADTLKADKKPDAGDKYNEALAKLEQYRKQFEKGKDAGEALMRIGRIWQDGLEDPLIHSIETFEQVLKDYPRSEYEPEALFRLAKAYEKAHEFEKALALYAQLLELYPKSKWSAEATYARGKILADKMDKHDEAAKEFEKMARDYPDDPRSSGAAGEARSEKTKAASEEGEKYGKSRYGGTIPYDTSADKALPPADMYRQFTAQKLDAESYDLDVDFIPAEHRITVHGTLKVLNRGEDKKDFLLMLGEGLQISSLTVDGAAADNKHSEQTLKVVLPSVFKKDAEVTVAFTYTGQYADADAFSTMRLGPGGMSGGTGRGATTRGARAATRPASATAPASTTEPGDELAGGSQAGHGAPAAAAPDSKLTLDPQMALGEYGFALSGAAWYPITIIGDVFDAHVTLHTPGNMQAVTNGGVVRLATAARPQDRGSFEFQTKNPVFGLYFAYGPYVVQQKKVGDIQFYTYLRPANAAKHDAYVDVTNNILSFYASKFAGFPYEKMAIIDTPLPPFLGGVGPASLMFLQETMVDHPEVPETLLAHELAHQWFGNLLPINLTDPNYSQWLSEGFATYCDALYTEHKDGPEPFKQHIERYHQLFFQLAMSAPKGTGSIRDTYSPMSPLYRPVIYEKGALVLHMLRKVMGDDKFFRLLRQFVETYRNKPTTVDDFRRMASEVHGDDLSWFFAEWIDQSIFAHWKITAQVTPGGVGTPAAGSTATGIAATGPSAAGGTAATAPGATGASTKVLVTQPDDLVKMPADITLLGAGGERQVVLNVMLDKKENTLNVHTPFVPVKVIVDEDNWVLKRPGSDNIWTSEKAAALR